MAVSVRYTNVLSVVQTNFVIETWAVQGLATGQCYIELTTYLYIKVIGYSYVP